jgi:hypothetical protein
MVISGDNDETQIRPLQDPKRKIFRRGGVDSFVMATPRLVSYEFSDKQIVNIKQWIYSARKIQKTHVKSREFFITPNVKSRELT